VVRGHKLAEIESRTPELLAYEASKPFASGPVHFVEWATIAAMVEAIALPTGARILDVGCGGGWTSLFLAEAGYAVTGYDLVPSNVELARRRAERWGSDARFEVADMEDLPDGDEADAALVFEALHHSTRHRAVLQSIGRRLRPDGWLLIGEPTWLHRISPGAAAARRELGWVEKGFTARGLRRDLREAGFREPRRFFQPTAPYERRGLGFAWQLVRLVAANAWVAPHGHLWLAAQRSAAPGR
jgi:2-polyprenyl-3-methyl-5-hydroxy-6-metoxy-1,4-benzoquinol methylase